MRLLVVSYAFEPQYSANAVRWGALTRELAASGVSVTVITSWLPGTARREVVDGIEVIRVGGELSMGLRARLRKRYAVGSGTAGGRHSSGGLLRRLLVLLNYSLWQRVFWPDHACLWFISARRAVIAAVRQEWDAIISVSFPFTDHLILLSCRHRARTIPWIAESGDPFSFLRDTPPNNLRLYGWLNRVVDAAVTRRATAVVVPNVELKQLYDSLPGASPSTVKVIPHVVSASADDSSGVRYQSARQDKVLRFCYAGALAKRVRDPARMLQVMREALLQLGRTGVRVSLDLYGAWNDCSADLEIVSDLIGSGIVRVHGEVDGKTARSAIKDTDVLINVGNRSWFRQPSKVVEYMATGKPIVNFAAGPRDSSESMMKDYPVHLTLYDDAETVGDAARRVMAFAQEVRPVSSSEIAALLARYTRQSVAAAYRSLVAEVSRHVS